MVKLEKHIDSTHIQHIHHLHPTKNTTSYTTTHTTVSTAPTTTSTQAEAEVNNYSVLFPPLEVLIQAIIESLLLLSCPLYKATTTATKAKGETVGGVYMYSDDRCDEEVRTVCVLLSSFFDIHSEHVGGDNSSVEKREIASTTAGQAADADQRPRAIKATRINKRVRVDATPNHSISDHDNTTVPTICSSSSPSQTHNATPAKRVKSHIPSPSSTAYTAITHMHTHSSHWICPSCTLLNIML